MEGGSSKGKKKTNQNLFSRLISYLQLTNLFLSKKDKIEDYRYEQLIELLFKYSKKKNNGSFSEQDLLHNILNVRNKRVQNIMIPRVDIVAIKDKADFHEVMNTIQLSGYSRFPIYKDSLDDIRGFIHAKDIIQCYQSPETLIIPSILRQIIFVSPYMKIFDLLYEMKIKRIHMAIVVDEFGGVDGLTTIEDVIEEIVGEIEDEHDKDLIQDIHVISEHTLEASAKTELDELEKHIGNFISDEEKEEFNTLGGLIVSAVGYIPAKNELITHKSGVEFKILSATPLKINKVCVYYDKFKKQNQ